MVVSDEQYYPSIGSSVHRSVGVTPSERLIQKITEDTFFKLWCYAGLFNDEGIDKRKTGTELCDLLVCFGDDILIVSDKSIGFNSSISIEVAWPRWYRRAIAESARQVLGAENWLTRFPDRVFLDAACTQPFPLALPPPGKARFHRVLLANNSYLLAKRHFGRGSSGSLMIIPPMSPEDILKRPFSVGDVMPGKGFFHVLNEYSLSLLLNELGTLPDLMAYLNTKEELLARKLITLAAGEEEVLAHYFQLGSYRRATNIASQTSKVVGRLGYTAMMLSEGLWDEFKASDAYADLERLRLQAQPWGSLIDDISTHVTDGTALGPSRVVADHERVVRVFCEEPLASRALLSMALLEKLDSVPANHRSARLVPSPTRPDVLFVLVLFPPDDGQPYDDYRREREAIGYCYALVAKLLHPKYRFFAMLLTEPLNHARSSRDFAVYDIGELTATEREEAKRLRKEENILSEVTGLQGLDIAARMKSKHGEAFAVPTTAGKRPGRNDPCPCGSGRKFKICHGHWDSEGQEIA